MKQQQFAVRLAVLALVAGMAAAPAFAAEMDSPAAAPADAATQNRMYFRQHSFDFPAVFRSVHPGPSWVLQHAAEFHLSPAQTAKQTELQTAMRHDTMADMAALKAAYAKYAADAHEMAPATQTLLDDVGAIGKAQTALAGTMIPYHLQAYAALDAAQQKIFASLVAAQ